jgi:hypothetical protein
MPGNTGERRGCLQTLHFPWAQWALQTRGRNYCIRSTGGYAVPPRTLFLSSQATGTTAWHHMLRMRGRIPGYLCTTARSRRPVLLGECHAQVTQRPVDTKSSVAWELRRAGKAGSTQPWCAQVKRGPPPYVPGLPRTQRKDTSTNRDRASSLHFLPARLSGLP